MAATARERRIELLVPPAQQEAVGLGSIARPTGRVSLPQGTRLAEIERVHGTTAPDGTVLEGPATKDLTPINEGEAS